MGAKGLVLPARLQPATPSPGRAEVFFDQITDKLMVKKSDGTVVDLEAASGGGGSPTNDVWTRFDPTEAGLTITDPQSLRADAAYALAQSTSETLFDLPDIVSLTQKSTRNGLRFVKRVTDKEGNDMPLNAAFEVLIVVETITGPPSASDDIYFYGGLAHTAAADYRYACGGFMWDYGSHPRFYITCGGDTNYFYQTGQRSNKHALAFRYIFLPNDISGGNARQYFKNVTWSAYKADGSLDGFNHIFNVNDDWEAAVAGDGLYVGLWVGRKSTTGGDSQIGARMYYNINRIAQGWEPNT